MLMYTPVVLIKLSELRRFLSISPCGVLHVGAHLAEESSEYEANGCYDRGMVIWVEAQSHLCQIMRTNLDPSKDLIINCVAWHVDGELLPLYLASNSESSSLFKFQSHSDIYPDIKALHKREVLSSRLDSVIPKGLNFNFLNLDLQGAELNALMGLGKLIEQVDYVYSEVSSIPLYSNGANFVAINEWLTKNGFVFILKRMIPFKGWGDGFWIRKEIAPKFIPLKRLQLCINSIPFILRYLAHHVFKKCSSIFKSKETAGNSALESI